MDAMVAETAAHGFRNAEKDTNFVETIYFGGGTPSLLVRKDLDKLLNAVHQYFTVSPSAEITLEANPDDINSTALYEWKSVGINRLSIGVQSFMEEDLRWMNRVHNASQALHSIMEARDAGFENYSVDLIFGTPTLSDKNWKKNVETLIKIKVPHVAAYSLTVEPSTALQRLILQNKKENVDPEKQASQYHMLMDWMLENGYQHYEISNFCKPGKYSRHNSSYWRGIPYIGIGPSAHSFDGKKRSWNISNNALYIKMEKNGIPFEEEILTATQQLNEYIMISLRTMEGLDLALVRKRFGKPYADKLLESSLIFEKRYHLTRQNNRLILTNSGKLYADAIAAGLFF